MSKLKRTRQSIESIISNLKAKFGNKTKHYFLPSLRHALDGYLIGHIPVNVLEVRPPMKGLISLTIAQISKSSNYYLFVKDDKKNQLEKNLKKSNLKFRIRTTHPAGLIKSNRLLMPELVIINEITNQTIVDDTEFLEVLITKIKNNYQPIGLFAVLSPELSSNNWYSFARLMEANTRPFTFITARVLAGKLNLK